MNAFLFNIRRMLIAAATAESLNIRSISVAQSENDESEDEND